jgi:hypothetical protein
MNGPSASSTRNHVSTHGKMEPQMLNVEKAPSLVPFNCGRKTPNSAKSWSNEYELLKNFAMPQSGGVGRVIPNAPRGLKDKLLGKLGALSCFDKPKALGKPAVSPPNPSGDLSNGSPYLISRLPLLLAALAFCGPVYAQSTTGIYVNSSNNVGIGTTSPASDSGWASPALDLSGTRGTAIIRTTSAGGIATLRMTGPGANHIDDWAINMYAGNTSTFGIFPQAGSIGAAFAITNAGNVGIGTTSPLTKLHVYNGASGATAYGNSYLTVENSGRAIIQLLTPSSSDSYLMFGNPDGANRGYVGYQGSGMTPGDQMVFYSHGTYAMLGGNVGIGTTTPSEKLDVTGNVRIGAPDNGLVFYGGGERIIGTGDFGIEFQTSWDTPRMKILNNGNVGIGTENPSATLTVTNGDDAKVKVYSNGGSIGVIDTVANSDEGTGRWLSINPTGGNVGIGVWTPQYPLDVAGTIHCGEIITNNYDWADYVFDKNYRLAPLSEVEGVIKREGHLPGMPSAADVAAHGLSVGEMQAKLLQKIEELTLHQIEQEKRIEQLEKENTELLEKLTK